jgi:integrase
MRTRLKGIHTAYGKGKPYYYAWKGGPRLRGAPGSAEFMASYNEALAGRPSEPIGTVGGLIDLFERSVEFTQLAPRTRLDYAKQLKLIRAEFGSMPIAALPDPRARGIFKEWRNRLAERSVRQADYAWVVLARVFSVAKEYGKITVNPCEKGGRIYQADRSEKVWTDEHEAAFMTLAPPHLRLALQLALWTGQRQGDLLRLTWGNYDGKTIRLRQGKTGARVVIPVGAPLRAMLDDEKAKKRGAMILLTLEGTRWTADGFRSSWRKACAAAGVEGVSFHDLRGTAVTRLSLEEATPQEIATITGLSLADVSAILDAHYLHRDPALAEKAVKRLEARTVPSKPSSKPASGSGGSN